MTSYTTAPTTAQWGQSWKWAERPERLSPSERPRPRKWKKCPHCKRLYPAWRRKHVWRCCPDYSDLWAGDQRIRLFAGLAEYDGDAVTMVTVTAPGAALLPWDEHHCAGLGEHRHSGVLGCRVVEDHASSWNKRASSYWSALHDAAQKSCRDAGLDPPSLLVKAWEYQKRGVLHLHLVFAYSTATQRESLERYVAYVDQRAESAYFGFVDRKLEAAEPSAAAAYLSSYFVGGKGGKLDIRETVKRADVPANVIYMAPHLLQKSGLSMRTLRLRRYLWWQLGPSGLRLTKLLGLDLETVYELHKRGWWGRAFVDHVLENEVSLT